MSTATKAIKGPVSAEIAPANLLRGGGVFEQPATPEVRAAGQPSP